MINKAQITKSSIIEVYKFLKNYFELKEGFDVVKVKPSYIGEEDVPLNNKIIICITPLHSEMYLEKLDNYTREEKKYKTYLNLYIFADVQNRSFLLDISDELNFLLGSINEEAFELYQDGVRPNGIKFKNPMEPDKNEIIRQDGILELLV